MIRKRGRHDTHIGPMASRADLEYDFSELKFINSKISVENVTIRFPIILLYRSDCRVLSIRLRNSLSKPKYAAVSLPCDVRPVSQVGLSFIHQFLHQASTQGTLRRQNPLTAARYTAEFPDSSPKSGLFLSSGFHY